MSDLLEPHRIVVKVGSSSLYDSEGPRLDVFGSIADQIVGLRAEGSDVGLVSSGAIAAGKVACGVPAERVSVAEEQAFAAVGQLSLMTTWQKVFAARGVTVAQVLVTNQELFGMLDNKSALTDMLDMAFARHFVPIFNENDAVATDEIKQGDNDKLSAYVGKIIRADELYLLGTASAFYADYPANTVRIEVVTAEDVQKVSHLAMQTIDPRAKGGMQTKLDAVRIAHAGKGPHMDVFIVDATQPQGIIHARLGIIGTLFVKQSKI